MGKTRNVIQYNSVGLFLTDAPSANPETDKVKFFNRVQNVGISIDVQRQNIQHIGGEDFLARKIVQAPDVNINASYLLTDGYEENLLGINVAPAPITVSPKYGVMDNNSSQNGTIYKDLKEDKNMFMVVGDEGFDLTGYAKRPQQYSGTDAIGIGNCFLTNYNVSASVGGFAEASVQMVASDINYACMGSGEGGYSWTQQIEELFGLLRQVDAFDEDFVLLEDGSIVGLNQDSQEVNYGGAINPSLDLANKGAQITGTGFIFDPDMYHSATTAIHQGGINVKVRNLDMGGPILNGVNQGACNKGTANIQSFDISVPFAREDLRGFESNNVYGRKLKMPQLGTISFSLLSNAFTSGSFQELLCNDKDYEIEIDLSSQCKLTCKSSETKDKYMKFTVNNARFQSYSFNEQVGSFATVDCSFSFGMSSSNGLFVSGCYENERHKKCVPSTMMSPRNLGVANITPLEDAVENLQITGV